MADTDDLPEFSPALSSVIHRALDLTVADRLVLWKILGENVAGTVGRPATAAEIAAERELRALACMHQAKQELGLRRDDYLEGPAYERAVAQICERAEQAGDEPPAFLSVASIIRAWTTWANANQKFREAAPRDRLSDYRLRKAAGAWRTHEEFRTALRAWLRDTPPPPEPTQVDYQLWANAKNDELSADQRPYPSRNTIETHFNLRWADLVAWAASEDDVPLPVADRDVDDDPGPYGLVSSYGAARVIIGRDVAVAGANSLADKVRRGRTPLVPVARVGRNAYFRADAEAVRDGREVPHRERHEISDQVLTANQLPDLIGLRQPAITPAARAGAWHLVPQPAGKVSGQWYWTRADVDAWCEEHADFVRRRKATPAGRQRPTT